MYDNDSGVKEYAVILLLTEFLLIGWTLLMSLLKRRRDFMKGKLLLFNPFLEIKFHYFS